MWELDYKENWAPKNWCFWPVVLEKTLESPLDYKESQPVHHKGNQSWIFIVRTDAFELWCWRRLLRVPWAARRSNQSIIREISPEYSLEGLMLKMKLQYWPPDAKSWLIWKDPNAGKDRRWEEKGTTENEMVGRHHQLNGRGFGWTLGVGDGQGSLVCCGSWDCKESGTTEQLNWTEFILK